MQNVRGPGAWGSHLNLLERKIGCDVTFEVGPEKEIISCHKIFLIARSSVFEIMFKDRWASSGTTMGEGEPIKLPDVEPGIFHNFLTFIYADIIDHEIDTSVGQTEQLLYLAEKYDVSELKIRCDEMLKKLLELSNALQIYSISEKFGLTQLFEIAQEMIATQFKRVISDTSFLTMDKAVLTRFVASDDTVVNELELFLALKRWAESECEKLNLETDGKNLRLALGEILPHIRFPLLRSRLFRRFVVPTQILTDEEKLAIFKYICVGRDNRDRVGAVCPGFKINARRKLNCGNLQSWNNPNGVILFYIPQILNTRLNS